MKPKQKDNTLNSKIFFLKTRNQISKNPKFSIPMPSGTRHKLHTQPLDWREYKNIFWEYNYIE